MELREARDGFLIALSSANKSVKRRKKPYFLQESLFWFCFWVCLFFFLPPSRVIGVSIVSFLFIYLFCPGQTSLSQDSEAALMMDYAAAMDSSCKEADPPPAGEEVIAKVTSDEKLLSGASETVPDTDPQQSAHTAWALENGSQQWDSNTLLDQSCEEMSGSSLSVSETGSVKKSKGT